MIRLHQTILIGSFLPFCWLAFMVVHELGHVLGGLATGGEITKVVLHPFAISRTDVSPNPSPHLVVWSGPILGVILPLVILVTFLQLKLPGDYLARFFAGFCLVANGVYIGIGSFTSIGDVGDMKDSGSPIWLLWIFGIMTIPVGFLLWHRQGPKFGFGDSKGLVNRSVAYISVILFGLLFSAMILFGSKI